MLYSPESDILYEPLKGHMVFNFEDLDGFKSVEQNNGDQYLLRTVGKTIIKLQKRAMAEPPEWFGAENVFFDFPSTFAVFPIYNPQGA